MKEDEIPEDFPEVVVWALDRILKDEYEPSADSEGNLGLLLGKNLGPRNKPVDLTVVEETLKKCLPQEQFDAVISLKDRHSPQELENVLRILFAPEVASRGVEELRGAGWSEILLFIHVEFTRGWDLGEKIGELIIKEREGLSTPKVQRVENLITAGKPDLLTLFTARRYAREFQKLYPMMVRRAELMRLLPAGQKVPELVDRYLVEASRCFIYGHFLASLFLCRSAIISAAEDRLRKKGSREVDAIAGDWLKNILKLAREKRIMDETIWRQADDIRKLANDAIHGTNLPNEEECKNAHDQTRRVLQYLYEEIF